MLISQSTLALIIVIVTIITINITIAIAIAIVDIIIVIIDIITMITTNHSLAYKGDAYPCWNLFQLR